MTIAPAQTPALTDQPRLSSTLAAMTIRDNIRRPDDNPRHNRAPIVSAF